jgi:hypothetical protein
MIVPDEPGDEGIDQIDLDLIRSRFVEEEVLNIIDQPESS